MSFFFDNPLYSPDPYGYNRITLGWRHGLALALMVGFISLTAPDLGSAQTTIDLELSGKATYTGSTTTVAEDDTIDWLIQYRNISGAVTHDVSVSNILGGNQNFVAGSAQAPAGWIFDETSQTFSAPVVCPNNTATCGGAPIQPMGVAVNIGNTGGDGFAPVIHPTSGRIYNTYHNQRYSSGGIIQCVDTLNGSICAGYPMILQSGDTTDNFPETTGVATDVAHIRFEGDRYYYPVYRLDSSGTPEWGLGCFDVNSVQPDKAGPCDGKQGRDRVGVDGFVRMGPQNLSVTHGSSAFYAVIDGPWKINDKLYLFDFYEMQLHCYDPNTDQLCGAPYPASIAHTDFPAATSVHDSTHMPVAVEVDDARLLMVMNYANVTSSSLDDLRVRCWDTQSESVCWGSAVPVMAPSQTSKRMNAFLRYNTTGDPDAICSVLYLSDSAYPGVGCATLNGTAIASQSGHTRGVPNILLDRMNALDFRTPPKELARNGRTYFPSENSGNAEGVVCWNWATNAFCSGFGSNGHITDNTSDDTEDYGISYDERTGCFWALGHTNRLWNFDANGNAPCQPSTGAVEATVTPATFFCGSGVGNVAWSWDTFQLDDVALSDWQTLDVEIVAADGTTVLQNYDLKSLGVTTVDISTLPNINLQASLSFKLRGNMQPGSDLFSGGREPQALLHFASDTPGELCFRSQPFNGSCDGTATATTTAEARLQGGVLDDSASATFTILPTGVNAAPILTVAPAAASSFHANATTRLYHGRFDATTWAGHLRAQPMDADGVLQPELWDAAAVLDTQAWDTGRTICTLNPTTQQGVPFQWTQLDPTQQTMLNTHALGVPDTNGQARLQYLRGDATHEGTGLLFRVRQHRLGALVHSGPHYVGEPLYDDAVGDDYHLFRSAYQSRDAMVYIGSNDGMLHGFNAETGMERIAYVPGAVMGRLSAMTDPNWLYHPSVDGALTVLDAHAAFGSMRCGSGTTCWRSVLAGSLGPGGQGIYALDVTDPGVFSEANADQLVLWEFTDTDDADLGETWGQPSLVKMQDNRWTVVIGNGYNSTAPDGAVGTGRAVLYILFIEDGLDRAWTLGTEVIKLDTGAGSLADPNGLSTPAPVDLDGDLKADFIYAGDLHGNVWKFDVRNPNPATWATTTIHRVFTATSAGGARQPITTRPEAGLHPYDADGLLIYVGTGKYLEPADATEITPVQSLYALWDEPDNPSLPIARPALAQQQVLGEVGNQRVTTKETVDWSVKRGWYLDLPTAGERVVSRPVLRNERLIFTTFRPTGGLCDAGGTSWLMEIDAVTGSRLSEPPLDANGDRQADELDLVTYDDDGDGQDDTIPGSGIQSTQGVLASPAILKCGQRRDCKYSNGSAGAVMETVEDPGRGATGRQSWRTLP